MGDSPTGHYTHTRGHGVYRSSHISSVLHTRAPLEDKDESTRTSANVRGSRYEVRRPLLSSVMVGLILNQLLLIAYIQTTTAEPDGSQGSPVATRTGGGFLVSLVARGSGPDLPRGSTRRQNGGVWRPLDPPIAPFNSTRAERRCP